MRSSPKTGIDLNKASQKPPEAHHVESYLSMITSVIREVKISDRRLLRSLKTSYGFYLYKQEALTRAVSLKRIPPFFVYNRRHFSRRLFSKIFDIFDYMFTDGDHMEHNTGEDPGAGKILIANPFLKDPNFSRTVVLICEHREEGSFGFIFNRLFTRTLDDLVPDIAMKKAPVYFGGPVQQDTIHFIHRVPRLIEGGLKVLPGIYWGGDFEKAIDLVNIGMIDTGQIKFFVGYSGWDGGQLDGELKEHSWIVSRATRHLLFDELEERVWTTSLRSMGSRFAMMANYPIDPTLN